MLDPPQSSRLQCLIRPHSFFLSSHKPDMALGMPVYSSEAYSKRGLTIVMLYTYTYNPMPFLIFLRINPIIWLPLETANMPGYEPFMLLPQPLQFYID